MAATAGELRQRVTFSRRTDLSGNSPPGDGYGGMQGPFDDQFTVAARVWPRLGGETVMAARLASRQPVTITVRQSTQTRLIAPDWKAKNARTNVEYAIHSIVDPDEHTARHGMFLDILCEAGTGIAP